jgi:hypothetical protein
MDRRALLGLKTASSNGGGGGQASYTRLPTITANVRRPDGRLGIMTIETGVDVPDAALRARAQQSLPRLQAAYTATARTEAAILLPGAPPNIDRLVAQLQAATDRTLGRAGARLLIGTVMVV